MGVVKQLLPLAGRSLLETVLDNLRRSAVDEVVLVLGFSSDAIRRQTTLDSVKVVVNEEYRQGMATSLRAGLSAVSPQADAVVVILADQPFVRPETINRLISEYRSHNPPIAIPLYRGSRGNPVLIDRSVFPELMRLSGDVGCRTIFGNYAAAILNVAVDDPGILFDLDTQADLDKIPQ